MQVFIFNKTHLESPPLARFFKQRLEKPAVGCLCPKTKAIRLHPAASAATRIGNGKSEEASGHCGCPASTQHRLELPDMVDFVARERTDLRIRNLRQRDR